MREIKFRVWDKHNEKWVYETIESICQAIYFNDTSALDLPDSNCDDELPERFCLFTGLKDKNGKEIFEGDIVDVSGNINIHKERGEIVYEYGCFFFDGRRFMKKHLTTYPRDLLCECQTTFYYKNASPKIPLTKFTEIIGNIYESPELLTESES